ncbi:hypothetical protein ACLOJK_027014, partial [Asimina triloba]
MTPKQRADKGKAPMIEEEVGGPRTRSRRAVVMIRESGDRGRAIWLSPSGEGVEEPKDEFGSGFRYEELGERGRAKGSVLPVWAVWPSKVLMSTALGTDSGAAIGLGASGGKGTLATAIATYARAEASR